MRKPLSIRRYERSDKDILLWWNSLNDRQRALCIAAYAHEQRTDTAPATQTKLPKSTTWGNKAGLFEKIWLSKDSYVVKRKKI